MRKILSILTVLMLLALMSLPGAQAQKMDSTPVDLSAFWNADGWQNNVAGDPTVGTNHASSPGSIWTLDNGDERVVISSLPANVVPGEVNVTEDGEVAFLLPPMNPGELDVYYVAGDTIPVPPGKYKYVYLACMSGNGTWPGAVSDWAADVDPDTGEVYDARSEVNTFTPIYEEGAGDPISVGIVNDWFWSPPKWVAPASGDPNEIIADYLTYEGDADFFLNFVDGLNYANHDYGQYTYIDGEGDFIFTMEIPEGLTAATLYTVMWGNIKMSATMGDFADDASYVEIFNSVTTDQIYPSGGDGYEPNRKIRSHDLSSVLTGSAGELFIKFEDAAPGEASPFGPRVHQMGLFTGPTVETSLGQRLWPGLVRSSGGKPTGGLILIKKKYLLDDTKTLTSLVMPNNIPRGDPILSIFAITLANEGTGAQPGAGIFDKEADWAGRGSFKVAGDAEFADGVYAMSGNGDDIWDNTDEGFFLYTERSGNWSISGKVKWVNNDNHDWSKIGVMIRDQGDVADSAHYWMDLRGAGMGDRTDVQWRTTAGASSGNVQVLDAAGADVNDKGDGVYLRVSRTAPDTFKAEYSYDGINWVFAHEQQQVMGDAVAYGLAITNHTDNENLAVATVSDVKLEPYVEPTGLGPEWVIGSDAGVWKVENGVLSAFADTGHDPKHAWVNLAMADGNYTVKCDCRMLNWENADLPRAGISVRINPDDNGANPGSDRGLNLLFHDDTNSVDILNDLTSWGTRTDVAWEVGTWYTMALTATDNVLDAYFIEQGGDVFANGFLATWDDARNSARSPGFPGLTASTFAGLTVEFDNFEVIVNGNVVFSDDFGPTTDVADWSVY